MSKRNIALYAEDIRNSIRNIEAYTRGISFKKFKSDFKTIDAVVRNFEIIGEAAIKVPEKLKEEYNSIPWSKMIGMRNKVIHEYFGIDSEILWKTIKEDVPLLKKDIEKLKF